MFALNKKVRTTRSLGMVYSDRVATSASLTKTTETTVGSLGTKRTSTAVPKVRTGLRLREAKQHSMWANLSLRVCVLTRSMSPPDAAVRTWTWPVKTPVRPYNAR